MPAKSSEEILLYAKALLGSPYMWGTYGSKITKDLIDQKVKQYGAKRYASAYVQKLRGYVGKGLRATDCCGVVKYAMCTPNPGDDPKLLAQFDKDVGGLRKACSALGKISTLPEVPGLLLFIDSSHVGIYLGSGQAIEAVGSDVVRITQLRGAKWTDWGKLSWVTYPDDAQSPATPAVPAKSADWIGATKAYKNPTNTSLPVFADSKGEQKIGELFGNSTCLCVGEQDGMALVLYKAKAAGALKVGFADRKGVQG